mgnify:CR=1 FL=1
MEYTPDDSAILALPGFAIVSTNSKGYLFITDSEKGKLPKHIIDLPEHYSFTHSTISNNGKYAYDEELYEKGQNKSIYFRDIINCISLLCTLCIKYFYKKSFDCRKYEPNIAHKKIAELEAKLTSPGVGILPCIRQVDEFLQKNPAWKNKLIESHPECAFQALNDGNGLEYSKHSTEGIKQRTEILSKYCTNIYELLSVVKKDEYEDVLDSLCLAVTAKVGYKSISDNPVYDSTGLPMRIVVADI